MEIWMLFLIIAIVAVVIEMFLPLMFFINFAFAGIITAIVSVFWGSLSQLFLVFIGVSLLSLVLIKPLLRKLLTKENKDNFDNQYIGKVVKSIEPITQNSGAVTIYDERWEARLSSQGEEIPSNVDVKIVSNDSLILYVEKI